MQKDTKFTQQTLKGFRDFLPPEKLLRDAVSMKIQEAFTQHGFEPIQTPTLEYADLLLGKYGQEADKLVYTFADRGGRQVGLRYDQTVPTARFLAQYTHKLPKFFKRYQIQNVFRADKPQAGRFREFTQCDCDIFGTTSYIADAQILAVYYQSFANLGLADKLTIHINDRQSLFNAFEALANDKVSTYSIIQSIDKLDKLSKQEIIQELINKGLQKESAQKCITAIENLSISDELQTIIEYAMLLGVPKETFEWNPSIARGLDYYTGMIFEGKIAGYPNGSVGGGGRYDNLIMELSGNQIPAVGFGIGFDRVVEIVSTQDLQDIDPLQTKIMICLFAGFKTQALKLTHQLQKKFSKKDLGIIIELYPQTDKLQKQLAYADKNKFRAVIMMGENEVQNQSVVIKDLKKSEQITCAQNQIYNFIADLSPKIKAML